MTKKKTDKYDLSPADIKVEIDEQVFQNTQNLLAGRKRFTLELIGSPGIGKTQGVEQYPIEDLEDFNTKVVQEFMPGFRFKYKFPKGDNSIENQSWEQINNTSHPEEIKKKVFELIRKTPRIAVKVVRQSDFTVPEDISGLPTSESDLRQLEILASLCRTDPRFEEYKIQVENKIEIILKNIFGVGNGEEITELRNTSKFDFTEWERDVHELAKTHEHVILVLDDITRSAANNPSLLNVLMPILQEGFVGQRKLPGNCSVVITSNEQESDTGGFNYSQNWDEAQKDRLRSKKIRFIMEDWINWAKDNNVHESIILFSKEHPHYFRDGIITPRRMSELGQSITNKFGRNNVSLDDPKVNEQLLKTIYFHLGDSNHANYITVITDFVTFLEDVSSEINKFMELFRKNGWNDENKKIIKGIVSRGETIKLMITIHKICNMMTKELLNPIEKKAVVDIFADNSEDAIPANIRYQIFNVACEWTNQYEKRAARNTSAEEDKLIDQMNEILKQTANPVGDMIDEQKLIGQRQLEKFKNKK